MVAVKVVGVKLYGLFLMIDADWRNDRVDWTFVAKIYSI